MSEGILAKSTAEEIISLMGIVIASCAEILIASKKENSIKSSNRPYFNSLKIEIRTLKKIESIAQAITDDMQAGIWSKSLVVQLKYLSSDIIKMMHSVHNKKMMQNKIVSAFIDADKIMRMHKLQASP